MLDLLNELLWSKVLIVVLIGLGLWFTIGSRFVQFRYFGRMFRILGANQAFAHDKHGHLSSFQALMLSVAALASVLPARRAARLDPLKTLRE